MASIYIVRRAADGLPIGAAYSEITARAIVAEHAQDDLDTTYSAYLYDGPADVIWVAYGNVGGWYRADISSHPEIAVRNVARGAGMDAPVWTVEQMKVEHFA